MSVEDAFLRRLAASSLAPVAVLRGSALTSSWVPGRVAKDLDFCLDGEWTVDSLTTAAQALIALPDPLPLEAKYEPIWQETPWPGLRLLLNGGFQVDLAFAEPLGFPPEPVSYRGFRLRAVGPEMMMAWKIHSLVERGPRGRWHAKTLADLVLIDRHVKLDGARLKTCVGVAFGARKMTPEQELDGFLNDPTWGMSRGSRNKWKSYSKKAPWLAGLTVTDALARAREIVRAVLA